MSDHDHLDTDLTDPHGEAEAQPVSWLIEGYGPTEHEAFARLYGAKARKKVTPLYARPPAQPTIGGAELDALVATLRAVANGEIWRLKDIRGDYGLCDTAADAITALRAQPDWKAMAERLGEELDFLLYAITATDQYDNRFLTITGSTPMLKQLLEAESASRAALSDLAKMKGGAA